MRRTVPRGAGAAKPWIIAALGARGLDRLCHERSLRHNARAIYQRYMGWYDGNPSDLNDLPPEPAAKKYLERRHDHSGPSLADLPTDGS